MAKLDFSKVLDSNVEDIERPEDIPPGTYMCVVKGWRSPPDNDRQWKSFDCLLSVVAPTEDVNPDDLTSFGNVAGEPIRHSFLFEDGDERSMAKALWGIRMFCEHSLLMEGTGEMKLRDMLAASVNYQCLATVVWRPNKDDPNRFNVNVTRTAPM